MNSPTACRRADSMLRAARSGCSLAQCTNAEIEHAAFQGKARVFCIAPAGSTAVRLAARHEVVACDLNPDPTCLCRTPRGRGTCRAGRRRARDEFRACFDAPSGLDDANGARLPRSLRRLRADGLLGKASRHATLPRGVGRMSLPPSCVPSMPRNSSLPCRRDSAPCCGSDWKRDSPGIRML